MHRALKHSIKRPFGGLTSHTGQEQDESSCTHRRRRAHCRHARCKKGAPSRRPLVTHRYGDPIPSAMHHTAYLAHVAPLTTRPRKVQHHTLRPASPADPPVPACTDPARPSSTLGQGADAQLPARHSHPQIRRARRKQGTTWSKELGAATPVRTSTPCTSLGMVAPASIHHLCKIKRGLSSPPSVETRALKNFTPSMVGVPLAARALS